MALEIYSKDPFISSVKTRRVDRYFYALIIALGLSALIFSAWPFFIWQIKTLPRLTANIKNIPVPKSEVLSASTSALGEVQVVKEPDGFTYFVPTNLNKGENIAAKGNRPKEFKVSIPKLKIENAIAKVDSLEFNKNLSHFPKTALPGETGNAFITGHSVLPQFSNPKNYNTIFSKLPDLEIGDKVDVEINGKTYQYSVQYSKIVDPHDVSVLNPISTSGKNLTLMTCVPPGTNLKRLVVVTSLI